MQVEVRVLDTIVVNPERGTRTLVATLLYGSNSLLLLLSFLSTTIPTLCVYFNLTRSPISKVFSTVLTDIIL